MKSTEMTVEAYLATLPDDRRQAVQALREMLQRNLPQGFSEQMSYGMIGYVVPHTLYPAGYHCSPELPLPFINLASQKNFIALYHMGMYMDPALLDWFTTEWTKHATFKLDMGKSCIRFKKPDQIPLKLIGELATRMTPKEWITLYEKNLKK